MKVELLYFDGCPTFERLLPRLNEMIERSRAQADLVLRRVETEEDARVERFLGSPTVRVDGVDVEPGAGERGDFGLKCRLYRGTSGMTPTPPDEWITSALRGPPAAREAGPATTGE